MKTLIFKCFNKHFCAQFFFLPMCMWYMHTRMCVCIPVWAKGQGGNQMPCSVTLCRIPLWQSLTEPGARQAASKPQIFSCPPYQWGYGQMGATPSFVSLILMFELRSSCLQLHFFFYFDLGLTNFFYYSCFGGWMVCVQLLSSSTSSIWTQPLTTDKCWGCVQ